MTEANEKRYDEVPYESHPYRLSHPRWLATVAATFGLESPSPEGARILELGCASGGNLVPMAESLPNSTCLGVDLSSKQIETGKAFIASTGLTNVELRQESILNLDASLGQFDYIICHGVFSWVDRTIQQKILELCEQCLSPKGVAYISYNTYPGWHMKGMLRDMMRFHASRFKSPKAQISQSRALLNVLAKTIPSQDNPFGMLLKQESEYLRQCSDWYIYHEHLELENDPLYFHEFAQRAYDSGLQFLGEAELRAMLTEQLPKEIQDALKEVATNLVYAEQYMDFFRNRTFRQTLLCHRGIQLNRHLNANTFSKFNFASELMPQGNGIDLGKNGAPVVFEAPNLPNVTISGPAGKAAMLCLGDAWPEYLPLRELEQRVLERLEKPRNGAGNSAEFLDTMGTWFTKGIARISLERPPCVSTVSDKPVAATVARTQARTGQRTVTNLLHSRVALSDFDASVMPLLDGTIDRTRLAQRLSPAGLGGRGPAALGPTGDSIEAQVDASLKRLARAGLLRA